MYSFGGQRSFEKARSVTTNDRGEYRLFYVTPGRYYMTGRDGNGQIQTHRLAEDGPNTVQENYALSYYPAS